MKKTMPNEMTVKESGCTLDMYNNRGSARLCDVIIENTQHLISLDLSAVNGSLDIRIGDVNYHLSSYQVSVLIQFLSQRD